MNFSETPVTMLLIAANVIISLLGFNNNNFVNKYIMWPYGVARNKEYIRFVSSGFLHADFMHLFFNMFTLFFFGQNLEYYFTGLFPMGKIWYLLLYFAGMILADIPSYLKNRDNSYYRSLGASGAVSAVVFGSIFFNPWSAIYLYGFIKMSALVFALLYIAYCIYMGKKGQDNVNHDAHLWGSIAGFALTVIFVATMRPDVFPAIVEQLENPSFLGR